MKLYDMIAAPNPRRVRVFLAEKGIDIDTGQIDVMVGENMRPEYLAINPRGTIPALQLDDGTVIDEASAICRYFEATTPEPALYGTTPREKAIVESWIRRAEQDCMGQATYVIRNENPVFEGRAVAGKSNSPQLPALADRGRKGLAEFYELLNSHLSDKPFIAGESFSVADITTMCSVDFAEYVGVPVPGALHHLGAWRKRVSERPSAQA